jgi:hypothetical protein
MVWGAGPVFSFPTATATAFETGTWGLGASAVVLKVTGPMNIGVQYYANVEHPEGSAGHQLRFIIALLYPR